MAVNPLDLQVVFAQMNQVGKQQALIKESEVIRQDQASEQAHKEGEKDASDVPKTKDLSEGPGKIKDGEKKKNASNRERQFNKEKKDDTKDKDRYVDKSEEIKDPNLGHNIEIVG